MQHWRPLLLIGLIVGSVNPLAADEIYSNANGGGEWSDPATWRGGKIPTAEDEVVIARDDVVTFDRNDAEAITCKQLSLDPRGLLQFKTGAGPLALTVNGPIESYGYIRLDASKSAKDQHVLRLVAEDLEERRLTIAKGGGLVVSGKLGLPKGRKNVVIASQPPKVEVPAGTPAPDPTAKLEALAGSTLDLQRAEIIDVQVLPTGIDNTGAKPGERINIIKNRFTGSSRLGVSLCDSAVVNENLFERDEKLAYLQPAALALMGNPLIEVRGNVIRGSYYFGFHCYSQGEGAFSDNHIEKCYQGLYWIGTGFMCKRLTIKDCSTGMSMTSSSGNMEDVTIIGAAHGYHHAGMTMQFANLVFRDMKPVADGYKIYYSGGPLTLINSPIKPEDITLQPNLAPVPLVAGKPRLPMVQSLNFVVAQVSGQMPAGIAVELKTAQAGAPLPPGAPDPNVRNCPAPVSKLGLTPLPKSLEPIIVRGWQYDADAKLQPAPTYQFNILGPVQSDGLTRKPLKSLAVTPEPTWYRPDPNDRKPTFELSLP